MSKVLVGCQHCHAKFKIESKNVPELGHKSLCPNCGSSFTMWHPDDYYLERYPREYAVFILDQKRLGYVPKIRYELKRIQAMEQWLKQRGTSILLASDALLEDYCAEVRQRLGSEEAAETKITLNQFFEVLAREKIRPGHPCTDKKESGLAEQLERVEDHGETPAPLVDPGQKIPKKTGRKRLILMAVLIFIMAVGGGFLLYREKEKKEALSHELQNLHERHDKEVKALKTGKKEIRSVEDILRLAEEADIQVEERRRNALEKQRMKQLDDELLQEEQRRRELTTEADKKIEQVRTQRRLQEEARKQEERAAQLEEESRKIRQHVAKQALEAKRKRCTGDCDNGYGVYTYENGERYEGQWQNGERSGKGTLIEVDGDKWVGMWQQDKRVGVGQRHLAFADYKAREAERQAKLQQAQQEALAKKRKNEMVAQEQAKGQQSLKEMIGKGMTGCVIGDCENGQGSYIYPVGDYYYGEWKNGVKTGFGGYVFSKGGNYVGDWVNDQKHGQGTYTFKNGQKYIGGWLNDKKHGLGIIVFVNGQKVRTQWNQGEQIP